MQYTNTYTFYFGIKYQLKQACLIGLFYNLALAFHSECECESDGMFMLIDRQLNFYGVIAFYGFPGLSALCTLVPALSLNTEQICKTCKSQLTCTEFLKFMI